MGTPGMKVIGAINAALERIGRFCGPEADIHQSAGVADPSFADAERVVVMVCSSSNGSLE